jgi:hypothetical protein
MPNLLGAWSLVSCVHYRNDIGNDIGTPTFGNPPGGQIQYTSDGRMSAFLMDPAWAARGDAAARGVTDFFAYAGRWRLDDMRVTHDIEFCSIPSRVGTRFVRTVRVVDEQRIELLTDPEISKSGAVYVAKLLWERHRSVA